MGRAGPVTGLLIAVLAAGFSSAGVGSRTQPPATGNLSGPAATALRPVTQRPGMISTLGNRLVDGSGRPITLLGVNRSGAEFACIQGWGIFDGPTDDASVAAMAAWRIGVVRIPLNEDCWLGINGVPVPDGGPNYRAAIQGYVTRLHRHGMAVILDLHWAAPGTRAANLQLPMPDSDHAPTFWTQVAAAYRSDPLVMFDLFNEPFPDNNRDTTAAWACIRDGGSSCTGLLIDSSGVSWSYNAAGLQSLLDAVRATGATNIVLAGGPGYSGTLDQWLTYHPVDPIGHVAASWHSYNFGGCLTVSCWTAAVGATAARYPVIAGEIGEDDCAHGYIDRLMAWLDLQGISYVGWTWNTWGCASGPSLISDYSGTPTAFGIGFRTHLSPRAGKPVVGTIGAASHDPRTSGG